MACFIVPAAEAAVVGVIYTAAKYREKKAALAHGETATATEKTTLTKKLSWLLKLLLGGSFLLAFEHVWHGEVVPWPPFLTAAANPADTAEMLHEMATVGVAMALTVTAVWGAAVLIHSLITKKNTTAVKAEEINR